MSGCACFVAHVNFIFEEEIGEVEYFILQNFYEIEAFFLDQILSYFELSELSSDFCIQCESNLFNTTLHIIHTIIPF